jgi:outer membrane lipoprotein-sorting protein
MGANAHALPGDENGAMKKPIIQQ